MVMFGCVVAAGIRIITQTPLSRRDVLIVGLAFGAGLGVESVPAFLSHFPPMVGDLFEFGGHQRWAGSDSAEPYSAAGAGGDENDKESG